MSGIIEIWRRKGPALLPVRFTVGTAPQMADGAVVENAPPVKSISYRETNSFAGKRHAEKLFCISFEESNVQRFIPSSEVIEIAYETKIDNDDALVKAPPLEQ